MWAPAMYQRGKHGVVNDRELSLITYSYIYIQTPNLATSSSLAMDQFVLFGDSITQHSFSQETGFAFGAELSNQYARRLDVIK
jgi:hypothetical protein